MMTASLRRVATLALLPVVVVTALRAARRARARREDTELWAEATGAVAQDPGT